MNNANVIKNDNAAANVKPLELSEQKKLSKAILGYGKLLLVANATGLAKETLRRAAGGLPVTPGTGAVIRAYLQTL